MPHPTPTEFEPLDATLRPLTASERRKLRGTLGSLEAQARTTSKVSLWGSIVVFLVLWALTLLASDVSWMIVTVFWVLVGAGITFWVRRSVARDVGTFSTMAWSLRSALERDEAEVYDLRSRGYVEFEELEDEGACYAFDLGDGRIAFLFGQEFYPNAEFPSLEFSLSYPLDQNGYGADMFIETRGVRAEPVRTIPAKIKWDLEIPESLTVIRGSLDDLEELLKPRG